MSPRPNRCETDRSSDRGSILNLERPRCRSPTMSITLEQVSKEYGDATAISDVTAHIEEGELFVLLGPSGSGKSTLLRAIAGLTPIDHGRIVLHGRDVTNIGARHREVGLVFQNYALFRHMTVADNIEFALRARWVRAKARRKRRDELLDLGAPRKATRSACRASCRAANSSASRSRARCAPAARIAARRAVRERSTPRFARSCAARFVRSNAPSASRRCS